MTADELTELTELELTAPMVAIFADDFGKIALDHLRNSVLWTVNLVARERHLWTDDSLDSEAGYQYLSRSFHVWRYGPVFSSAAFGTWRLFGRDIDAALVAMVGIERAVEAGVRGLVPEVVPLAMAGISAADILEHVGPTIRTRAAWVRGEIVGILTA